MFLVLFSPTRSLGTEKEFCVIGQRNWFNTNNRTEAVSFDVMAY